jgi:hypothetical protein
MKTSLKQKLSSKLYFLFLASTKSLLNERGILGSCAPRAALFFWKVLYELASQPAVVVIVEEAVRPCWLVRSRPLFDFEHQNKNTHRF